MVFSPEGGASDETQNNSCIGLLATMDGSSDESRLMNRTDRAILLHRDCHFAGLFSSMITYYRAEKRGVQSEFSLERLGKLASIETKLRVNLSDLLFADRHREKVRHMRREYAQLRAQANALDNLENPERALARLILADSEEPIEQLTAVERLGARAVPHLIELFSNATFYDPLSPGFGLAPELAAKCLGSIADTRAINVLFAKLGDVGFFTQDVVLEALRKIGDPSRDFLLHKLQARPFTEDNQKAAFALVHFREDFVVAATGYRLLTDEQFEERSCFLNSLVMICEGLAGTSLAPLFQRLQDDDRLPQLIRQDVREVIENWT